LLSLKETGKGTITVLHTTTRGSISEETANSWILAFKSEENETPLRKFLLISEVLFRFIPLS
jgi:hypothetical protein